MVSFVYAITVPFLRLRGGAGLSVSERSKGRGEASCVLT